jgi:hypothetical protein
MYPTYVERSHTIPAWVLAVFAFASRVRITILIQVCR